MCFRYKISKLFSRKLRNLKVNFLRKLFVISQGKRAKYLLSQASEVLGFTAFQMFAS